MIAVLGSAAAEAMPRPSAGVVPDMRVLRVFSNARLLGWLATFNNIWQFEYAQEWVSWELSWDISPALSRAMVQIVDGSTVRPVQWFFDNLLPEEGMREAIAQKENIAQADAFALLESLGAESAGALVLLPLDVPFPELQGSVPMSDADLSARIANMPKVPIASTSQKRMSLAGAQQKLLVNWNGVVLSEPVGLTPSTHILKPEHLSKDYAHSVINEFAMMSLAKRLGLDAPKVWRHYCPEPVYIVERFDRVPHPDGLDRLQVIDSCQLLNASLDFKYKSATLAALKQVVDATRTRARSRLALFRWLVFNVLIGNSDNHLKNISFMVSNEGVELAPTYDLLCTGVYHTPGYPMDGAKWPDIELVFPLPSAAFFKDVTFQGLVDAGLAIGVPARVATREITTMRDGIDAAMVALYEEIALANASLPAAARVFLGGELHLLRTIHHVVIMDMVKRLT